jgi:hypothetical protein
MGAPRVSEASAPADALPNVTRRKLSFAPAAPAKAAVPPLTFAWLVDDHDGFAAASKNADTSLKAVVQSAHGEHPALAAQPGLSDAVARIGDQAALFAYLDGRLLFGANGAAEVQPAPLFLSLAKRAPGAALRFEVSQPLISLALRGAAGQ